MLQKNHPFFPTFEELMRDAATHLPVFDLGTSARFVKEVGLVRHLFKEQEYRAGGYRPDNIGMPGGCDFHCDIEDMRDIPDGCVGSVICMEVLEHVQHPPRAVSEIHRVLKEGGIVIAAAPFLISYHGKAGVSVNPPIDRGRGLELSSRHSSYGDYWRFTHEGLALLFAEAGFARVGVHPVDGWLISRLQMLGLYHRLARLPGVTGLLARLDRPKLGRATTMHYVRAVKC